MEFILTKWHVPRGARPDAEIADKLILIKNVSELRPTYQVRLLLYRAIKEKKKLVLDVPKKCVFSKGLKDLIQKNRKNIKIVRT